MKSAGQKLSEAITKAFPREVKIIPIKMRPCDDVPRFIKKLKKANRKTAKSNNYFD